MAPHDLTLRAQATAVLSGEIEQRELLETALARRQQIDPGLNAIVAVAPDEPASERRSGGALAGVPIAVKDSFALPWWAPRDATPAESPVVGRGESAVYRRLARAGAAVIAVANMHQLAIGSTGHISSYGACANPWDRSRCPGGSSSGSAASVSARIVAGSVGTDAAGSIRIPAAYCGLTGLKPTWGAVPVEGYTAANSSLGAIGAITRDSADCRALAGVLVGRTLPRVVRRAQDVTIGIPRTTYWENLDPGVEERCRAAIDILRRAGCTLRRVRVEGAEHTLIATMLRVGVERIARLDREWLQNVAPQLDPVVRAIVKCDYLESRRSVLLADRLRALIRHELRRLFGEVAVLAWPTVPAPAPRIANPRVALPTGVVAADVANVRQNGLANLAGIPAISIPCGWVGGLPVGLTFHSAWSQEAVLLDLAELMETETARVYVDAAPLG